MGDLIHAKNSFFENFSVQGYRRRDRVFDMELRKYERRIKGISKYPKSRQTKMLIEVLREENEFIEEYFRFRDV